MNVSARHAMRPENKGIDLEEVNRTKAGSMV